MGAGRERAPHHGGGGGGGGAPAVGDAGPAGAAARAQAAEIAGAANAQALRSQVWAAAEAHGDALAEGTVAAMPAVGPALGRSLYAPEAQAVGQAGVLAAWGSDYDAARVPLVALARQLGALQVLAARGVDPTTPAAYQGEVAAMTQVTAAPAVSEARAGISEGRTAGAFDGWLAARQAVAAAHAGVQAAAAAAQAEAARAEAHAVSTELGQLQRGPPGGDPAGDVLALVRELVALAKGLPKTPLDAATVGHSLLGKLGAVLPGDDRQAEQLKALKARVAALEAKGRAHGQTAAQRRLVQAAKAYDTAALNLRAEAARMAGLQADRRRQLGNLGVAIDEQRAPGASAPVVAPGPDASDRATALLTAAAAVEVAEQAAQAALHLLADLSGPDLLVALEAAVTGRARARRGAPLHPLAHLPGHGPSQTVREAAAAHRSARQTLEKATPDLAAQAADWRRVVAPITGR